MINKKSMIKTSVSFSGSAIDEDVFQSKTIKVLNDEGEFLHDSVVDRRQNYETRLRRSTYRGAITYSNKLSAKNRIQAGTNYALFSYNNNQNRLEEDGITMFANLDFNENVGTIRNFVSWKHRFNEDITLVTGLHNMNVLLNKKSTLEPRIAVNWDINKTNSVHAGYGSHSSMESIHHYFAKVELDDGTIVEPNKDLGLLKACHFVLGYKKRFTEYLVAKVEVYYQDLYNLPVENIDTSYFATINEGVDFRYVDLVNEGTGKNYGIELTLERFFDNNYYYLVNGSLYNSTYKSLEGIERNTKYNNNFLVNVLIGKEFQDLGKKNNQSLTLNSKIFYGGGQKYIPLLRDADGNVDVDKENNKYWDYEKAYDNSMDNIFQLNLSASYKFNRPKATHEVFIDLINVTDNRGDIYEYYDEGESNSIGHVTQFGFFPNLMYRVYF